MKVISLASALLLSALAFAPASAAPAAPASGLLASPGAVPVQYSRHSLTYDYSAKKKKKKYRHYRSHRRHRYVPGHRYRYAPRGWHRYDYRPFDWYLRGCIVVGPIWFCP